MTALHRLSWIACLLASATACAQTAFVRVAQLGYESGRPARAYLMVDAGAPPGTAFRLLDAGGHAAFSGPVGAATGSWGSFQVFPLDFVASAHEAFTLQVDGATPVASAPFRIDDPAVLYGAAVANALSFFQNQRDGSRYIASALRHAPAHLNDRRAAVYATPRFTHDGNDLITGELVPTGEVIDVEGGWFDAGDYLKFVQTHSYTVAMLLTGVRDFPAQMGHGAGAADFTAEARFGLEWLLKMWDDEHRVLRYQVGIGTGFRDHPQVLSDHDLWRLPQDDDTQGGSDPRSRYLRHRPVFAAGAPQAPVSPNLAGRLAASFALGASVFRTEDPAFAQRCLLAAEHVFALADTRPGVPLLTVAPHDFYPETEWRDDLEWGAAEIALALQAAHADASAYLRSASGWARRYIDRQQGATPEPLNLYDVGGLAHFELYRAIGHAQTAGPLPVTQAQLLAAMQAQLAGFESVAASDPFGFGFPWATWDTPAHGVGLAILAKQVAMLTGDAQRDQDSRRWLGNVLGANAWGLSLVVGDGMVFPACLQHQVANLVGSLDGRGAVLAGAIVEGPNATDSVVTDALDGMKPCGFDADPYARFDGNGAEFRDDARNYPNTEPAIDLTAASPLLFAWRIAGAPAD